MFGLGLNPLATALMSALFDLKEVIDILTFVKTQEEIFDKEEYKELEEVYSYLSAYLGNPQQIAIDNDNATFVAVLLLRSALLVARLARSLRKMGSTQASQDFFQYAGKWVKSWQRLQACLNVEDN